MTAIKRWNSTTSAWEIVDTSYIAPVTLSHTFAIGGAVAIPVGDVDYVPPFFVSVSVGRTVRIMGVRTRINSGTSATFKIQKNGADVTGLTGIVSTTTAGTTTPTPITLANNDMISLVVTAVSGSPKNLSASLFIEYA